MNWLRKWFDSMRGKPSPEPPAATIDDPKVEEAHLREENIQKREKAMEDGEGRRLEEL
jgi:transposase-like protein